MKTHLLYLVLIIIGFATPSIGQDFAWAKNIGGNEADIGSSLIVDNVGNVYTLGYFNGIADFDPGVNTFNLSSNGGSDIFITKFDMGGNFIWAKKIGGSNNDYGRFVQIDKYGDILITGSFVGTVDFNSGSDTFNLTSNGSDDIFILKLKPNGNFIWAVNLGGSLSDESRNLITDDSANIYTTGWYSGNADFDPGSSNYQLNGSGISSYISKLDSSGSFVWAKAFSGTSSTYGHSLALGKSGSIYAVGGFKGSTDFDPDTSIYTLSSTGMIDIYILKLSSSGSFNWAIRIGSGWDDYAYSVALDKYENIFATGYYNTTVDFDPGSSVFNMSPVNSADFYILKLDSVGSFDWAKSFGGNSNEQGNSIALDDSGYVYVAGKFKESVDFDPNSSSTHVLSSSSNSEDAYISKLDSNGNFVWAHRFGNFSNDFCQSIILDNYRNVYFTGGFKFNVDFDPAPNNFYYISSTGTSAIYDAYVCKLLQCSSSGAVISVASCESYSSPSGKYKWTSSGIYKDTILNVAGCDSIITIGLQINKSTSNVLFKSVCDSLLSPSGKYTWYQSGTYTDTLQNSKGCDSTLIIGLTVAQSSTTAISDTACVSYLSPSGKYIWTQSGNYLDTLTNAAGCDSILNISLTIIQNTSRILREKSCGPYLSPSGKYLWPSSGTYYDTISLFNACDTNFTVILDVDSVDTSVSITGSMSLKANALGAIYQWVDCNNSFSPIPGKTHQSFTTSKSGSYALVISQFNCTDTSSCYQLISTGLEDNEGKSIFTYYPNPASGELFIQSSTNGHLRIFNTSGQLLYEDVVDIQKKKINLEPLANGMYIIQFIDESNIISSKLLIAK